MTLNDLMYGLEGLLTGNSIKSKVYGEGIITHITGNNPNDLIVHIQCGKIKKAFNLAIALKTKNINFLSEDTLYVYNQYMEAAKEVMEEEARIVKEKKLEEEKLRKEEEARKEAEKEAKKAAQAFERTKKRMIEKFEATAQEISKDITYANEYYYSLGWLAKNLTSVYARMPDYLDSSFTKYFGIDAPRKLEDSTNKNCQWSYAFTGQVKNIDKAPMTVKAIINPNSKNLSGAGATAFFWDLVANRGFQFGKIQNVMEIKSHIPKDMMNDFELGYNT